MAVRVFISYSHVDRDLVLGEIRPLLKAAPQLQVTLDVDDFEWGKNPRQNMEKAVRDCDFTLGLITQEYVDSEWATLESMQALDLERLVPIVFRMPTKVPSEIRDRASYGLALDPAAWDEAFRRLLTYLQLTPAEVDQALQTRPPRNYHCLRCRVGHSIAQTHLNDFERIYESARPSYHALRAAKALHDRMHDAQPSYHIVRETKDELKEERKSGPESLRLAPLWEKLKKRSRELDIKLQAILREARHWRAGRPSEKWERDLEESATDLQDSLRLPNPDACNEDGGTALDAFMKNLEGVRKPLWTEPTFLNRTIFTEKERLQLPPLFRPLGLFAERLRAVTYDPDTAGVVGDWLGKFAAFQETGERVLRLVGNHNLLQTLDDECTSLDEVSNPSAKEIQRLWKGVRDYVPGIDATDLPREVSDLQAAAAALDQAIAAGEALKAAGTPTDSDQIAGWLATLRQCYCEVRLSVNGTFHATDDELKQSSAQLPDALQELKESLDRLRNYRLNE